MTKKKTLGEYWDAGEVQFSHPLSDDELLELSDRTEVQLEQYPPGFFRARRGGRPKKGEVMEPTSVRSIRLVTRLWARVESEADQASLSINRWIEYAILEKISREQPPELKLM